MFAKTLSPLLVVAGALLPLLGACGGANAASQLARAPQYAPKDQTKCRVSKSRARPLIVEWPSADRQELETKIRRGGVVAVRYVGCEMDVLNRCVVPAKYTYLASTRKEDRVVMKDEGDLYANLPVGAARLEGRLQKAGSLTVSMNLVGRYEAERPSVRADELSGDCAGATHFVYGVAVGAFDFYAGADAAIGEGAGVTDVGVGSHSEAERESLTKDGDPRACESASPDDKGPPPECGALIRVEVVPLDEAKAAEADSSCASGMHVEEGRGCVADETPAPDPLPAPTFSRFVWQPAPSAKPRMQGYGLTLLSDGRVLMSGGASSGEGGPPGASPKGDYSELFDPLRGSWRQARRLQHGRSDHAAVLLADGRVLVCGGWEARGTAEAYDPAADRWMPGGKMVTSRAGHTATLLADGRVLIVGGDRMDQPGDVHTYTPLEGLEVYDPRTAIFSPAGRLPIGRNRHTATRLTDGRVLIAGGEENNGLHMTSSAFLWDPATGKLSATAPMTSPRRDHTATLLPDGRVLVAGGSYDSGKPHYLGTAEIFDPATRQWHRTGSLAVARHGHSAALLADGRVVVVGGRNLNSDNFDNTETVEIYDPATESWTMGGAMKLARADQAMVRLMDDRLFVVGGLDGLDTRAELGAPVVPPESLAP